LIRRSKISVAFVTNKLSRWGGGVSVVVDALSGALAQIEDFDVRVFGLSDPEWEQRDCHLWRGAPAIAFPTTGPKRFGYAPRMLSELLTLNPDVVHSHGLWMHPTRSVLQWARRTGRPYVVSPHGMLDAWAIKNSATKKYIAGALYQNAHLHEAVALHALCDPEAAAVASFGLRNPVHVIPNGIDGPSEVSTPPLPWTARGEAPIRVMLYLGRLHPQKNIPAFIEAWATARRRESAHFNWRLAIAGWDQDGTESMIRAAVRKFQIEEDVGFLGPLFGSAKEAAFRNASAFVLPSMSEGLPMTVLEACSYGLPVLMTDSCNLREAFALNAAHRLDLSPDKMALDLTRFLTMTEDERLGIGSRGRAWVERDFTWRAVAQQMAEVYRRIAHDHQPSATTL
jgi:glycosyltransferase involved in cell wall biosynthesis